MAAVTVMVTAIATVAAMPTPATALATSAKECMPPVKKNWQPGIPPRSVHPNSHTEENIRIRVHIDTLCFTS